MLLLLFCALLKAQTDTSRITPSQPNTPSDTQAEPQPAPTPTNTPQQPPNRKRPKAYNDYVNGKRVGDTKPFTDNLYYGCNLQLGFYGGNGYGNIFYYDVSPHVGYKLGDVFSAGVQIIYNNQIQTIGTQRTNYNIYGSGVFGRALILNRFFLQAEYDVLSVPGNYRNNAIVSRYLSDEKLGGIGYKSPLGDKLGYFFMILYDFQPTVRSPYFSNPLIYRAGLSWNF